MSAIRVEGVRFGYGARDGAEVLRGVSLQTEAGTIMCLMGVNGCGKSTLIDCILGEHVPTAGVIELNGCDVSNLNAAQRARIVAYVPQVHERSFPYSVLHVVLMGRMAHVRGLAAPDADDKEIAREALATCGMEAFAEREYTSLSGGEMQMVMLARALAQRTPIVLMDEPTAHLDFRNELVFLETVERLVRDEGVTVLMATHAPDQAFHLKAAGVPVDVALMAGGHMVRMGDPDEVLDDAALRDVFGIEGFVTEVITPDCSALSRVIPLRSLNAGGEGVEEDGS